MKKIRFLIPLLIVVAIGLAAPFSASAESLTTATLSTGSGEFTVGDPIPLTLSVTHPAGHQVILPQLEANWGELVVRSQSAGTTVSNPDGTETTTQVLEVSLFSPGEFSTLPLPVTVSDGSGQLSEVTADPLSLTISSVLVEGDSELRDIKPQAALPYMNLLPWVVGFVLLGLGLTAVFFWLRRRRARLSLGIVDNRLPHEVALAELYRVETLDLPISGRFKEHYTLVSDCLRVYMEKSFQIPILERTTGEIKVNLKRSSVSNEVAVQFVSLLEESDLVKFSKITPDLEDAHHLLLGGRQIIEITKPLVTESGDDDQESSPHIPSGPGFGKNGRNPQAEVTA